MTNLVESQPRSYSKLSSTPTGLTSTLRPVGYSLVCLTGTKTERSTLVNSLLYGSTSRSGGSALIGETSGRKENVCVCACVCVGGGGGYNIGEKF